MMKNFLLPTLILLSSNALFAQSAVIKTQSNQQLSSAVTNIEISLKDIKQDLKRAAKLLDNKAMFEMFQRLDDVSQDVSELRGQVEQQEHLQQRLQKRQRELYLDLDRRLREIELNASAAPAKVVDPIQVPTIRPVIESSAETAMNAPTMQDGEKKPAINEAPMVDKQVVPPVVKAPPKDNNIVINNKPLQPMSKERKEYQKAFDLLKEGRYNKAKTAFKAFLIKYPSSSYAGNAQYWSGEANYVTRQFATAMKEFKLVITRYPASNKVPDAMLKLGYTFYETRQMDSAKQILTELVKRFSKSTAARLAKKRLKRMQKEGL